MNYDKKIEEGISRYLEKVASYLRETPADETDEIIRDLQSHIYDALAGRSGAEPTPADLEAVLSEMDPPESYAAPAPGNAQPPPTKPTTGRSLGSWAMATMIAGVVLSVAGAIFGRDQSAIVFAGIMGTILELLALILGLMSWREKTGKVAVIVAGIFILWVIIVLVISVSLQPDKPMNAAARYVEQSDSTTHSITLPAPQTQPTSKPTSQPADPDAR